MKKSMFSNRLAKELPTSLSRGTSSSLASVGFPYLKIQSTACLFSFRIFQRFAIAKIDSIGNIVYRHCRYNTSTMYLNKGFSQSGLKLSESHSRSVHHPSCDMYLRTFSCHNNIKNAIKIQHYFFPI